MQISGGRPFPDRENSKNHLEVNLFIMFQGITRQRKSDRRGGGECGDGKGGKYFICWFTDTEQRGEALVPNRAG